MYPRKVEPGLSNNVVGADCVEFKPVENSKVLDEAGSPAHSVAWEEVTESMDACLNSLLT